MARYVKNLIIDVVARESFSSNGIEFENGKSCFIMSEYSDDDSSDITDTINWLLPLLNEGKLELCNPQRLLPEHNMIDRNIIPYMEELITYCREHIE